MSFWPLQEKHRMSKLTYYNPSYSGDIKIIPPPKKIEASESVDFGRAIIQRRAAFELAKSNGIVNFGIGLPDGVDLAATAMGLEMGNYITTVESGIIGGIPNAEDEFGTAINPEAIIDSVDMFGLYDGMGIDLAVLGMGEADEEGNVECHEIRQTRPRARRFYQYLRECEESDVFRDLHRQRAGSRCR